MSNISTWSTTAASNNSAAPNGAPEGMAPSGVNDVIRENMAATKKWYGDWQGSLVSAGTSTAYTLTTNSAHATLAAQSIIMFRAHVTCGMSPTLNVDGLGALPMRLSGNALSTGNLIQDVIYAFAYNATTSSYDVVSSAYFDLSALDADMQKFPSSGTYTKPISCTVVLVELWSGGGGGPNETTNTTLLGGGSGGEYISYLFDAADVGSTVTVTVGAGGPGALNSVNGPGSVGGNTTFGSLLTAIGGNPGTTAASSAGSIPRSITATIGSSTAIFAGLPMPQAGYGSSDAGGNCQHGGAGGGGSKGGLGPATTAGGTSAKGGNGGGGNNASNTAAGNGVVPSGGGGASSNNGGGGNGANGYARVTSW